MAVHDVLTILQNGARARLRSVPLPYTSTSLGLTSILLQHGFIHRATRGTIAAPSDPRAFAVAGPASRRLWVDLKYSTDDRPVLSHARTVSKPSRRIWLDARELLRLVTGRRAQFISPLQLGEIVIVKHKAEGVRGAGDAQSPSQHDASGAATRAAPQEEMRGIEEYVEAREAVGRGIGGEVIARVG